MLLFPNTFWSSPPGGGGGGGSGYVNSVQHVSITIPTGATSATATISSVGSYAFVLYDGGQTAAISNTLYGYTRVELTNSTTITAYRNASSPTYNVTVKCCVIDAKSSLVNSVQSGVATIGTSTTSGTASVSSTNSNYTALIHLGSSTSQSSLSYSGADTLLSYSGTTITASRLASGSNTIDVGFVLIEFNSSALNSNVQSIQKTWTNSSTSTTQSITSVSTGNTLLFYAGSSANSTSNAANIKQNAVLTNGTTVTFNTNSAGSISCYYNLFVVELASGVLASNVQRGTTTISSSNSSSNATISSVTTSMALMNSLQFTTTQTSANMPNVLTNVALTGSTTVTASRAGTTSASTVSWEVAEFT